MGLKVIASCGSDEKVNVLRDLGVQHVINRRTDNIREALKKYGPIDIYFDNVGGEMLEAAIENAAMNSRFIICGSISSYNTDFEHAYGVRASTIALYRHFTGLTDRSIVQNLWLVNRYRIMYVV